MRDGQVVKGVKFRNHRVVGEIIELAERYCQEQADELVFYDITASPDGRSVDRRWVTDVARVLDIPFCVAGGIRSVADAEDILNRGADKISVNSPALQDPGLIEKLASRFGSQCVVVGIDSLAANGGYSVCKFTGDAGKASSSGWATIDWIREVQNRGAGEIVLNCMDQDGVREGYDCQQLSVVRAACDIPLIASGGAGEMQHFAEVFQTSRVDGALAASVFHSGEISVSDLKGYLHQQGIYIRH